MEWNPHAMDPLKPSAPAVSRPRGAHWTAEERGAAFRVYFSTGSRRKARQQTGVPQRTLSVWLKDARYAEERRAVQAGLLAAVQQGAAQRGVEAVEATREAILVCRKALRGNPDGRTSSSLLSALNRARETEDRIQRLDEGGATAIHGVKLSDEDRAAFAEWQEGRRATQQLSATELMGSIRQDVVDGVKAIIEWKDDETLQEILAALAADDRVLRCALLRDVPLAGRLQEVAGSVVAQAARDEPAAPARAATAGRFLWSEPR